MSTSACLHSRSSIAICGTVGQLETEGVRSGVRNTKATFDQCRQSRNAVRLPFSNEPRSTFACRPKRDCACFASDIVQSAFAPLEVILQYHVQDCVGRDGRLSTNMGVVNARLAHMLERAYRLNWQKEDDAAQHNLSCTQNGRQRDCLCVREG